MNEMLQGGAGGLLLFVIIWLAKYFNSHPFKCKCDNQNQVKIFTMKIYPMSNSKWTKTQREKSATTIQKQWRKRVKRVRNTSTQTSDEFKIEIN